MGNVQTEAHETSSDARYDDLFSQLTGVIPDRVSESLLPLIDEDGVHTWNLRFKSRDNVLDETQIEIFKRIKSRPAGTFSTPSGHVVIILKATRLCNLRCTYCHSWRSGPNNVMSFEILSNIIHQVLSSPSIREVDFVWHGGEVTLLPRSYVEQALWMQQQFAPPTVRVSNSIQTNATRITSEWIELFKKYKVSVGVSIDGPPEVHDLRRVDKKGRGTSEAVKKGISELQASGLRVGALAVVDECSIRLGARKYLEYLISLNVPAVALLNALPSNGPEDKNSDWFHWNHFTDFLREVFAIWWKEYRAAIKIRELNSLVDAVQRGYTGLCIYRENCMGRYLTVEPNGDVSACDKYVGDPNFTFGNIAEIGLGEMMSNSRKLAAAKEVVDAAKAHTSNCPEYAICSGGCPHDVRLRQLHGREGHISCCGMRTLIHDVRSAVTLNS